MEAPRWLNDESEIAGFLHSVLDRLDGRPLEEWKRAPRFPVNNEHFPGLSQGGESADRQWELLRSLADERGLFALRLDPKRDPFQPEYAGASLILDDPEAEDRLRHWLRRPRRDPRATRWQTAVDDVADQFPGDIERLRQRPIEVPGRSDVEVLQGFLRLGEYQGRNLTLRQLAARCFWGHSKFLDQREDLVTALYPELEPAIRPLIVNVHLPNRFNGILFIENQDSYANAVAGIPEGIDDLALVYAAGFKGAARRIREPGGALLHCLGPGTESWKEAFHDWWFQHPAPDWPAHFWGDLDYAGMAILKGLRDRFPQLQAWHPGYFPMLDRLKNGQGHPADSHDKQNQSDPQQTGCPFADGTLLPALRVHRAFVDQEVVF